MIKLTDILKEISEDYSKIIEKDNYNTPGCKKNYLEENQIVHSVNNFIMYSSLGTLALFSNNIY